MKMNARLCAVAVFLFTMTEVLQAGEMARVVRAIDASSIVVSTTPGSEEVIVLQDVTIDRAPFTARREEGKRELEAFVAGRWVMIERVGSSALVYRTPDGRSLSEWVVAEGYGGAGRRNRELGRLERIARENMRGLWNLAGPEAISDGREGTITYLGEVDPARKGRRSTSATRSRKAPAGGRSASARAVTKRSRKK